MGRERKKGEGGKERRTEGEGRGRIEEEGEERSKKFTLNILNHINTCAIMGLRFLRSA